MNGHSVTDKEEIVQMVKENECQPVALTIRRGEKMEKVEVEPVQTAEMEYRLGLWIRDDTQGIGTVTYITEDGQFAALGHGISDPDTGKRIESTGGDLYLAQIHSIVRGTARSRDRCAVRFHISQESQSVRFPRIAQVEFTEESKRIRRVRSLLRNRWKLPQQMKFIPAKP